ncbi:hypothetical protein FXV77_05165 [Sphingobacterium phlebotomi]|uniref:Uncharacterized protein n=1 Tax=Sphingobacterium phlebotomi TaxID=2605433 RepID=A0A5D4H9U0_9SPHI|nr:hypothetical protein [Sphingobacterium phlebotomi]TYR37398.1 hypothetical protein FXV77_05165 [Sphingobacterium phlebotomi]
MGEYIKYRGREVKIGTLDNMYYTSYQKFVVAMEAGLLRTGTGSSLPSVYMEIEQGFRFRFPFPDEDKLDFGKIIEPHDRGIPIQIPAEEINGPATDPKPKDIDLDIVQQKPIIRESDGKFCLALVLRNPVTNEWFGIESNQIIRTFIENLIRNKIINEHDNKKKNFYRAVAIRILKGYPLSVLSEYKSAVLKANDIQSLQYSDKQNRRLNKGI